MNEVVIITAEKAGEYPRYYEFANLQEHQATDVIRDRVQEGWKVTVVEARIRRS